MEKTLYNNKEKRQCVLARKIDLENHVKKLVRAPAIGYSSWVEESPIAVKRSSVALGDSLDFVLLPDGHRVAGRALEKTRQHG